LSLSAEGRDRIVIKGTLHITSLNLISCLRIAGLKLILYFYSCNVTIIDNTDMFVLCNDKINLILKIT